MNGFGSGGGKPTQTGGQRLQGIEMQESLHDRRGVDGRRGE